MKCPTGKPRHSSEAQAQTVLSKTWARAWKTGGNRALPTRVYRCELCLGWHLTSQPRRNQGEIQTDA